MKKSWLILAGVAVVLLSCNKKEVDAELPSAPEKEVSYTSYITAATEAVLDADTKSVIGDGGAFAWYDTADEALKEKIDVYTDAGFVTYTCTDASAGTFGGNLGDATPKTVAVYPAAQFVLADKKLTVSMPAEYTFTPTLSKTPMVAQISGGNIDALSFKHLAALLKVSIENVPSTATQLVLETAENITGDFVIADCTVADAVITNAGGSGTSVAVHFDAAGSFTDKVFYIPIPTGTYDHFNLFLKDEYGNKLAGRGYAGKTIARRDLASGNVITLAPLQLSDAIVLNDTQIGLRWSEHAFDTAGEAVAADKAPAYSFGIYSDAACTSKLWDWETAANASVFASTPGHVFSGLVPSTTYYVKVKDKTNAVSAVKAFTTGERKDSFVKTTTAAVGEEIVYESFNDVLWGGGDVIQLLSGVDIKNWSDALGTPDVSSNGLVCVDNQDRNMLTNAHESKSSIGYNWFNGKPVFGWGAYVLKDNNERVNSFPTTLTGGVKFGGSDRKGYIVSPNLTMLSGYATLTVSFRAGALIPGQKAYVAVFPAGNSVYVTDSPIKEIEVSDDVSKGSWTTYNAQIEVYPGQRIGVGTKITDSGVAGERYFLDEVSISLDSYAPLWQKQVFVNDTQIGVRWSVTDFATPATDITKEYTFGIYTDKDCTSPVYTPWTATLSSINSQSPGYVFSGLSASTTYYVKVVNNTDATVSVEEYATLAADPNFVMGTSAVAGDKVLNQNFNEMKWAGEEYVRGLTGYKFKDWGTNNYYGDPDGTHYMLVAGGAMSILANAVEKGLNGNNGARWFEASTLKDWLFYPTVPPSNCGSLRFGAAGYLVSPQLNCLTGAGTVKVTVTVAGNSNADDKFVDIAVFDANPAVGTGAKYNTIDKTSVSPIRTQRITSIKSYKKGWNVYSADIAISAGQRIAVGASAATSFWLDDIKIELVSYDD